MRRSLAWCCDGFHRQNHVVREAPAFFWKVWRNWQIARHAQGPHPHRRSVLGALRHFQFLGERMSQARQLTVSAQTKLANKAGNVGEERLGGM